MFKVGDKVVRTQCPELNPYFGMTVGDIGTIKEVYNLRCSERIILEEFPTTKDDNGHCSENFRLATFKDFIIREIKCSK